MKVLVLGANGMLGSTLMRVLSETDDMDVFGTVRSEEARKFFSLNIADKLVRCDVENKVCLFKVFEKIRPDVVVNCISLSKDLLKAGDPLRLIPIYSLLPHRLASLCSSYSARLVHISTDGVFLGTKGNYKEDDPADARDLYGISKYLGEVHYSNTITLRTSIIGHELQSSQGLIDWFLSQKERCKCFSQVVFSGFPTVVLAKIIRDVVIPRPDLFGLYHLASRPISKCELLRLVAEVYGKSIEIIPDNQMVYDRSLNANRFQVATGYIPPDWPQLIKLMHSFQ
jgi:dTDP-4-dehydrorhamnose reductase